VASFDGLSVALSGLNAQRRALDIAGQNVANANTEGYTRQRVVLSAVGAPLRPGIWSGAASTVGGVTISGVDRLRDSLLEVRGQQSHGALADLSVSSTVLGQVEQVFPEPGEQGLAVQLSGLWSALHDVANQPSSLAARSALLQKAGGVADWLNEASSRLSTLSGTLSAQAGTLVDEVNSTATQLAELNRSIARGSDLGIATNELADQRDLLAMRLADLVGGVSSPGQDGQIRVMVGGSPIVDGTTVRSLSLSGNGPTLALSWSDGTAAQLTGGEVRGLVSGVAAVVPTWSARLDAVAASLATQVNAVHGTGFDLTGAAGGAFFAGTTASGISVAVTDPRRIAASSVAPGASGPSLDAGVATAMAAIAGSAAGPDAAYNQLVGELGFATQLVARRTDNQQTVSDGIDAARESQAGVNIDEEMAALLTFQRAYEAASRVITAVDQTLDTLINRTGLVGRA
jgi:flagellar hook-associated protein 1 FlgK